jgi:uncharacterized protein YndB with AHSA1/START domain
MSMVLEDKIEINASRDRVWQVTVDVEAWPKWSPVMESIRREDTGDFKLGSTALIKQKQMPETRWTVTGIEPGHRFTWQARSLGIDMIATHSIVPGEGAVISLLRIEMDGLLIKLLGPIMKMLVSKSLKLENQGLKHYCESGQGAN